MGRFASAVKLTDLCMGQEGEGTARETVNIIAASDAALLSKFDVLA